MRRYSVDSISKGQKRYYYIQDNESFNILLLPTKFLKHKVESNRSPNTIRRLAFSICYYLEYLVECNMELSQVIDLEYDEQNKHFVQFLYWIKEGNHTEKRNVVRNGTCNAYLKDVFRFFLYLSDQADFEPLKVLSYNQLTMANRVGVKRTIRSQSFKGYLKAEERKVRAAEEHEITDILQACTNVRDQLLLLLLAETGFRIGELLGIDYTRDIDYQRHTIRVCFREDNENDARAKNAEYRRAKISDDTFSFLMYYLSFYRKLLQHQNYLFINIGGETAGQALKVGTVYDMLKRMEEKTGIKLTPHMLRRYYANARWEAGWQLELISQALGHKHLDTTIKYLGVMDSKLIEASNRFYEQNYPIYGIEQLM